MKKIRKFLYPQDFLTRCYTQDQCVIFTGTPTAEYGRYRGEQAHRYSYRIHHGAIAEGLVIHHTCFCKRCVNPNHLEAVTVAENCQANSREGRMSHMNRLSPRSVIRIYQSLESERVLARRYGVSATTIRRIRSY